MKHKIPFFLGTVYVLSFFLVLHFLLPKEIREDVNPKVIKSDKIVYNAVPYSEVNHKVLNTFMGNLTGYGPDCVGCGGVTGCAPNIPVTNGNIYYNDAIYGKLRIVAADKGISCGSIVRVTANNLFDAPIYAIVLDRGGAIKGVKMDLLYESEDAAKVVGFQRNVKYEILRYGW